MQPDYALFITFAVCVYLIVRYCADGGINDWIIMVVAFFLPVAAFYYVLRTAFVALGLMSRY